MAHGYSCRFQAMGSPCEVLAEVDSESVARDLAQRVASEAWRIEDKYSRYIDGNIIDRINNAAGMPLDVDEETGQLLEFAKTLYALSDGAFDVTSGVLRRVWQFDGSDRIPDQAAIDEVLELVGWDKVRWHAPVLQLKAKMQLDLGGLGKEYAVDRATLDLQTHAPDVPCLINFGGDLAVTSPPRKRGAWSIGIEGVALDTAETVIELRSGAIATSGDARRFILRAGVRYSHVLDPRSGWPVRDAPSSVTVAADSCSQAGMLATLAMLKGPDAEDFLRNQTEQFWCRRN